MGDVALSDFTLRQQHDLRLLHDAISSTVHGGLFDAFNAEDYSALRNAGVIRSYIPAGCMAPLTKLTPKGVKLFATQSDKRGDGR